MSKLVDLKPTHFLRPLDLLLNFLLHELAQARDVLLVRQAGVRRDELGEKLRVLPAWPDVVDCVALRAQDALHRLAAVRVDAGVGSCGRSCRLKNRNIIIGVAISTIRRLNLNPLQSSSKNGSLSIFD